MSSFEFILGMQISTKVFLLLPYPFHSFIHSFIQKGAVKGLETVLDEEGEAPAGVALSRDPAHLSKQTHKQRCE